MALVVGVAGVHALWALFQWTQLVAARTGGSSFCGLSGSTSCVDVWNSPFASAVQGLTGMPIAGWGLVWSLAAFALPLWALAEQAGEREPSEESVVGSAWAATAWLAIGGGVAIGVLFTASLVEGHLCTTCVVTYTIVAIYAACCFVQTPIAAVQLSKGISLASGTVALSFVLLLVPGLRTPVSDSEAGRQVLEQLSEAEPPEPAGDAAQAGLAELLGSLPPRLEQVFSNELQRYKSAPHVPMRPPRSLVGPASAPVRLTEFTDALCSHCASLHETLGQLAEALPGAFAVEPRHFPLDAACNPAIEGESQTPVRCLAARAAICVEGRVGAFEYAGRIYENQRSLDDDAVYELAEPLLPKADLVSCVNDPATDRKLQDDIAWALEHDIHGTPLVLLNGRPIAPFGPLLYALIVTRGQTEHDVFAGLPEPEIDPSDPHAGPAH